MTNRFRQHKRTDQQKPYWRVGLWLMVFTLVLAGCGGSGSEGKPDTITLDYAYYSPTSLILKKFGWAEEVFGAEGIEVKWELSQGSNTALQYLNSRSVDFGSTAGSAALVAKANQSPIKAVYIFSQPEWTALVTMEGSGISTVADLKGKSIAATAGTDPFIFLLRALNEAGLSSQDVQIQNIQHGDGANALVSGSVDAWAGLDPHMARIELENNAQLFYRNIDFNTYGFLNVREAFAEQYPHYVEKVIELYERARQWAVEHPEETARILAEAAGISLDVAKKQIEERTRFDNPVPGDEHRHALLAAGDVLQREGHIDADADIAALIEALIDPSYAEKVINQ